MEEREAASAPRRPNRVNVSLAASEYETLEELARRRNTSLGAILRDALTLEKYVQDALDENETVQFVRKDGTRRELLIR